MRSVTWNRLPIKIFAADWLDIVTLVETDYFQIFQMYFQRDRNKPPNLIYFGNAAVVSNRRLPSGLPENDFRFVAWILMTDKDKT